MEPSRHGGEKLEATRALQRLARKKRPTRRDIDEVRGHAFSWALLGLARRGAALTARWLEILPRDPAIRLAHATFSMHVRDGAPAKLAVSDPSEAAIAATTAIIRGDLRRGIALARQHGWFLGLVDAGPAVLYLVWALSEVGDPLAARAVFEEWMRGRPAPSPLEEVCQLRTRAFLDSLDPDVREAIAALEEARAVAARAKLSVEREYADAELAVAYARAGRMRDATRIVGKWPPARRATSPVDAYRDLARACVGTLAADYPAAWSAALRVTEYATRTGSAITLLQGRFYATLTAPEESARTAFEDYKGSVRMLRSLRHVPRCRTIAMASQRGHRSLRGFEIVERRRGGQRTLPLARLWMPDLAAFSADIYYDGAQRRLMLRGAGPFELPADKLLARLLDLLLSSEGFSMPQDRLYEAIWRGDYHRLRDSPKLHVALHRLRRWLSARLDGGASALRSRGGNVEIDPRLEVRVIDFPVSSVRPDLSAMEARLLETVESCDPIAPGELMRHFGVARSTLLAVIEPLVRRNLIHRVGRGRTTRYSAGPAS